MNFAWAAMVGESHPENTKHFLLTKRKDPLHLNRYKLSMFLAKEAKICHWFPATAAVPWDVKVNNA